MWRRMESKDDEVNIEDNQMLDNLSFEINISRNDGEIYSNYRLDL